MIPIQLLLFLAAGQLDLRRIHNDHVIARVDVRRVDRLVLALEEARGLRRHPPEDLALGVDDVPLPLHTSGSGNKRTHGNPFDLLESCSRPPAQTHVQVVSSCQRTANQKDTGN